MDTNTYNEERKECLILPKDECDPSPGSQKCVDHSICSINGRCECQTGYEATVTGGKCLLKHGSLCPTSAGLCNQQSNLECLRGRCVCKSGYNPFQTNLLE